MTGPDGLRRMTLAEAAAWFMSQADTVMVAPDGRGAFLILGTGTLAALRALLDRIDPDAMLRRRLDSADPAAIPDSPELRLIGVLTAAARQPER